MAKYSDTQKAEALILLDANSGNLSRTAVQLDLPLVTLWEWARGRVHPDVQGMRAGMTQQLGDRMELLAVQCLDLLPGKLETATAAQLATITGIAIDKMQVLRGSATLTLAATLQITDEDRLRELRELMERLKQRQIDAQQGQEVGSQPH